MFGKITIRNIPQIILTALEHLSEKHERSLEGEARHALKEWVRPMLEIQEQSARKFEVSNRLNMLLGASNEIFNGSMKLKMSNLAEAIGFDKVEAVENWFTGELEPTFAELESVAAHLGGNPGWLKHGDGSMYLVKHDRIPEAPKTAVKSLLNVDTQNPVKYLYILRSDSKAGELMFVKQLEDTGLKFETVFTPYHVSEVIGAGGESALTYLAITLELLYKTYIKSVFPVSVIKSYIVEHETFVAILNGKIHPVAAIKQTSGLRNTCAAASWWEDFWDEKMFSKTNYWDGWASLTSRIHRITNSTGGHTKWLNDIRTLDIHEYWAKEDVA